MCFQRDSNKDKIIVWGFILGTAGLLGWAGAQRVLEFRERRSSSMSGGGGLGAAIGPGGAAGAGTSARTPGLSRRAGTGLETLRSPRDAPSRGDYQQVRGSSGGNEG